MAAVKKRKPRKAKKRVAPCTACKGFKVPARRVAVVRRNAKGQFAKATRKRQTSAW